MKVLVIGKGGREHAIVWRLHQSQTVWKIFCASGNPGINQIAEAVPIAPTDIAALVEFAKSKSVDLTIVGPDDPLGAGIVDEFTRAGLKIFGPTKAAARLETSKSFAKTIMREAGVPTADFAAFDDAESARSYVKSRSGSMVVKADGLALGKGVVVCHDVNTALEAVADAMERRRFGAAGNRVIVEEFLTGQEVSFFALCDGQNAIPLGTFQDHKTIFDGGLGPNTGGMGAYSPVPQFGPELEARVMREVVAPTLAAMNARGIPFRGVLFVGLMIDGERFNVLEFNARFGDPESQALMMRLDSDLAENLLAAAEGKVANASITLSPRSAVGVVLASGGYPGEYKKGIAIRGLDRLEGNVPSDIKIKWAMKKIRVKVFHSGTAMRDGQLVTDGGRVLTVTAMAPELATAVDAAYEAAEMIEFEGRHFRRDIARQALGMLRVEGRNSGVASRRAGRLSDRDVLRDRRRCVFLDRTREIVSVEGARAGASGRIDRSGHRDGIFSGARYTSRRAAARKGVLAGAADNRFAGSRRNRAGTHGTRRRRRSRISKFDCASAQRGNRTADYGNQREPEWRGAGLRARRGTQSTWRKS